MLLSSVLPCYPAALHQALYSERQQQVTLFKQRAQVMRAAADSLEAAVAGARGPVEARHAKVFAAVAAKFAALCGGLLPGLVGAAGGCAGWLCWLAAMTGCAERWLGSG
jgi:hypothetical protein